MAIFLASLKMTVSTYIKIWNWIYIYNQIIVFEKKKVFIYIHTNNLEHMSLYNIQFWILFLKS